MTIIEIITQNQYLNAAVVSWFIAQLIKVIIVFMVDKRLDLGRFMGSGGMPSSHTSTVCALAVCIARGMGIASPECAISIVFAVIVMHDAAGVRRAAGEQAAILNKIMESWMNVDGEMFGSQLREMLGHTPLQVFFGALLGIFIGLVFPM